MIRCELMNSAWPSVPVEVHPSSPSDYHSLCYTRTHSVQYIAHASRSCYCISLHRSCAHLPCNASPWRFIKRTRTASLIQTLIPRCSSMVSSRSSFAAFWLGLSKFAVDLTLVTAFTNSASDNVRHSIVRHCINCSQITCSLLCKGMHLVQVMVANPLLVTGDRTRMELRAVAARGISSPSRTTARYCPSHG